MTDPADMMKKIAEVYGLRVADILRKDRTTKQKKNLEYYRYGINVLDMVYNHPKEIDLENCYFTEEEEDYFE